MARGYLELREPDNQVHRRHDPKNEVDPVELELDDLFQTNPRTGLSSEQAAQRLQTFGPNEIVEKRPNQLLKFLSYFVGPIAFLIQLACIISAVVKVTFDVSMVQGFVFFFVFVSRQCFSTNNNVRPSQPSTFSSRSPPMRKTKGNGRQRPKMRAHNTPKGKLSELGAFVVILNTTTVWHMQRVQSTGGLRSTDTRKEVKRTRPNLRRLHKMIRWQGGLCRFLGRAHISLHHCN